MCRGYGIAKVIFFVSGLSGEEKMKKREEVLYHVGSTIRYHTSRDKY